MGRRIALWAVIGFSVACGWAVIALAMGTGFNPWQQRFLWTMAEITCPIAVLGKSIPLKLYTVIAINAATYALAGLAVELFRRTVLHPHRAG